MHIKFYIHFVKNEKNNLYYLIFHFFCIEYKKSVKNT